MTTTDERLYTGTADPRAVAERLMGWQRVAVLTHAKPDGDAIGSALGLARTLVHAGHEATVVFCPPWDPRFDAMLGVTPALFAESPEAFESQPLAGIDGVAVLDTGSFTQLGHAADFVRKKHDRTLIIDHHKGGDPDVAPVRLLDVAAASATQIVARVACEVLGVTSPAVLPADVAEPLYFGLATDTGWFRHPSVTPEVFRLAADLLDAGVEHNRLYTMSEMSDPPERLLLVQRALMSLRLVADRRAAVVALTGDDFEAAGAGPTHASGLVDIAKSVRTVEVSALLYETEPGLTKVSLRSKASALSVDVNAVASAWGGGGHKHAAGAKLALQLEDARAAVEAAVTDAVSRAASPSPSPGGVA